MPEKEGAEEKSAKSVVNKKQQQMMGEEGYDHLRDQGRIRKNKKKKDATSYPVSDEVKKTQKVNKGPSALERVKKKYKGQIMDVKKESTELLEMGKKFGPGGDPIKKKGFIDKSLNKLKVNTPVKKIDTDTDVKTEEAKSFDLTKVAEAFGGYIVESEIDPKTGKISATPEDIRKEKKILKKFVKKQKKIENKNIKSNTQKGDKLLQDINRRKSADLTRADAINRSMGTSGSTEGAGGANTGTTPPTTTTTSKPTTTGGSGKSQPKITGDIKPQQKNIFGGQDEIKTKKKSGGGRPRGSRGKIKTLPGQQTLDLGDVKGKQSPRMYQKGDTMRTDLRTVTRKKSRKATPKELERTKAQVAAADKKEKKKLRTPSAFERAIGTAPKKGDVPRKRTKSGIAGIIQRIQRFRKAGGPGKLKTYAKTKGKEGLKYAAANPLAAVVAGGQVVDTIAPRLPKLRPPSLDVGTVGRRTAG